MFITLAEISIYFWSSLHAFDVQEQRPLNIKNICTLQKVAFLLLNAMTGQQGRTGFFPSMVCFHIGNSNNLEGTKTRAGSQGQEGNPQRRLRKVVLVLPPVRPQPCKNAQSRQRDKHRDHHLKKKRQLRRLQSSFDAPSN